MKTYAAYYNNITRSVSSSGGIFSLISQQFEIVYGVSMSKDNQTAVYTRAEGNISSLRGSKYLQAKVGDTFILVKEDLINGKKVLFTGTACQVNGLHSFLQKEYSNLFCVDVICHGVPTYKMWRKFIKGKSIRNVNFRSKDIGWQNYGMKLDNEYIPNNENKYMQLYLQNQCIRPACYECVCKKCKKSDLTIGDFWGIDGVAPEMNDNKGVNLVVVRTETGHTLFENIKDELVWKEVRYEDGVKNNPSEYSSVSRPRNRDKFFQDLEKMDFNILCKTYIPKLSLKSRIKNIIRGIIN